MRTFACLAQCQGLDVVSRLASTATLEEFRKAVQLACVEDSTLSNGTTPDPFLVVSYNRKVLQQTGSGHFSPVAAYDEASDHILVLDTARFKYGAHWVPLPLMFEAMQPLDPDTGKSRGYVLLSFHEEDEHSAMPFSILFRTSQIHYAARKAYKDFLNGYKDTPITWEQVVSYWTKDGKDQKYIWEMTETQLTPMDEKGQDAVASVRDLIESLVPSSPAFLDIHPHCRSNVNRSLCLNPKEVMLVVYLASLDLEHRKEIVFNDKSPVRRAARQQLLAEAELLRLAIDMSDEIEISGGD